MKLTQVELDKCAESACSLLTQSIHRVGREYGWHQHLGSHKIGNVATAQALLAFGYWSKSFPDSSQVVNTLAGRQRIDSDDPAIKGGWTFVTNGSNQPTTEATAWSLLGLSKASDRKPTAITRGVKWLIANAVEDAGRRAWGSTVYDSPRVYATTLAIRALWSCHETDGMDLAVEWLLARQNSDGGWGATAATRSTMVHTAHAIIALEMVASRKAHAAIARASNFLLSKYCVRSLWNHDEAHELREEFEVIKVGGTQKTSDGRVTIYHGPTSWVIAALVASGRAFEPEVFAGIRLLIETSDHGSWQHPYLKGGEKKPLWAIHDSLLALSSFAKAIPNFGTIRDIKHYNDKIVIRLLPRSKKPKVWLNLLTKFRRCRWWIFAGVVGVALLLWGTGWITLTAGSGAVVASVVLNIISNLLTPNVEQDGAN